MTQQYDLPPLPDEFQSGNEIPVDRATFTRQRMEEVLRDVIEFDCKRGGDPVAWLYEVDVGGGEWEPYLHLFEPLECSNVRNVQQLYTSPQPTEPRKDEPIAWMRFANDGDGSREVVATNPDHPKSFPVYTTPRPAKPVKDAEVCPHCDSGTHGLSGEPKWCAYCGGKLIGTAWQGEPVEYKPEYKYCADGKVVWVNAADAPVVKSSEPVKVPSNDEILSLWMRHGAVVDFARALLAQYGQPTIPEGWKLVPEEPTPKQIVHMACQISGADPDGWFRTDGDDWLEHVDAAERAYKWGIESAPTPPNQQENKQ